jgi:hypothetical protein
VSMLLKVSKYINSFGWDTRNRDASEKTLKWMTPLGKGFVELIFLEKEEGVTRTYVIDPAVEAVQNLVIDMRYKFKIYVADDDYFIPSGEDPHSGNVLTGNIYYLFPDKKNIGKSFIITGSQVIQFIDTMQERKPDAFYKKNGVDGISIIRLKSFIDLDYFLIKLTELKLLEYHPNTIHYVHFVDDIFNQSRSQRHLGS